MTSTTKLHRPLPNMNGWQSSENNGKYVVTKCNHYTAEGLHSIYLISNDIKIVREKLDELVRYYAHPRESEFYGND